MLTPKLVCSCVSLNRLLSTTLALASRLSETTNRVPVFCDVSSFTSSMPLSSPLSASSLMRIATASWLTWYGISVTTIWYRSPRLPASSISALARIFTEPRPVR